MGEMLELSNTTFVGATLIWITDKLINGFSHINTGKPKES
jgi:hypothetical protein